LPLEHDAATRARLLAAARLSADVGWRAVAHGLAEFENRGLLPDGDQSWRSVLTALIDAMRFADPR
jgi:hypothetical protein